MSITVEKAVPSDAGRLAEVYNLSFYSDYLKYGENHYFYSKLGYNVTKEYMDGDVRVSYSERWMKVE